MFKSSVSRVIFAVLALVWLNGAGAAAPTYHIQLTAAKEDVDSTDDSFMAVTGSIRSMLGLTRHSAINLNADLYTRAYSDLEQNDRDGLLLEAIYNYVPSSGFRKPTFLIGLRQEFERFDQSSQDSDKTSILLGIAFRTSDRLTLTPGVELYQLSTDISERDVMGLFFNADLRVNSDWLGYLNLKIQQEDTTVDIAASSLRGARIDVSSAHLPGEPGYVAPPSTSSPSLEADSDNIIVTLGANYSIDRHQTIDVSYEYADYAVSGSSDVSRNVLSLDYFYKF